MLKYAFLFCAFIALSGQNARFVYKHSYLKDSLKPDAKTEDVTYLDVSPKGSFYYKYEEYKRDSVLQKMRKSNMLISQKTHYMKATMFKRLPPFLRDANGQYGLRMKYRFQTDLINSRDCQG